MDNGRQQRLTLLAEASVNEEIAFLPEFVRVSVADCPIYHDGSLVIQEYQRHDLFKGAELARLGTGTYLWLQKRWVFSSVGRLWANAHLDSIPPAPMGTDNRP